MRTDTDNAARVIWDYMLMNQPLRKCEAIFVLCSIDDRVAAYAAELFLDGYGDWLILSGGVAHVNDMLKTSWSGSEAEHFCEIAEGMGVSKDKIILETRASNTGENIQFTYQLLQQRHVQLSSFILVQKPYMERRTYATFKKQWPEPATNFIVSSMPLGYDEYFDEHNPKEGVIHIMVGDLQRIREYPEKGFQIYQDIPDKVWAAYELLVAAGYTKHLMK